MVEEANNNYIEKRIISSSSSSSSSQQEAEVRKGPWTMEEDLILINYIANHGEGVWNTLAKSAGLKRTGKSCRLRWLNYLRPDVRRGNITPEEQFLIMELHSRWGNRWSKIARQLPGRTDNEIKNYWRTRIQKKTKQCESFGSDQNQMMMMMDVDAGAGTSTSHSNMSGVEDGMATQPSCYQQQDNNPNSTTDHDAFPSASASASAAAAAPPSFSTVDYAENFWTVEDFWTMQPHNGD